MRLNPWQGSDDGSIGWYTSMLGRGRPRVYLVTARVSGREVPLVKAPPVVCGIVPSGYVGFL